MTNFDEPIDRTNSDSIKWNKYPPDVIPLWVADMDFTSPAAVLQALSARVAHGVFGYGSDTKNLAELIVDRLLHSYGWHTSPEEVVFLPGVVPGFNLACLAFTNDTQRVVVQSPVYPLLLHAPFETGRNGAEVGFVRQPDGAYSIDWDQFEAAVSDSTGLFILCNPQNPLGRVFRREELERMAEICLRAGAIICSDEIHCDLTYPGHTHVPIASLSPEIAQRTLTLMAPSKTYNLAGLQCSFAIIQNEQVRRRFLGAARGLLTHINTLGCTAALAAYRDGETWLTNVLRYLQENRDTLLANLHRYMPDVKVATPEGTYLAWLDCSECKGIGNPYQFFLEQAKVALGDGRQFGVGGKKHVRLNFACRREVLLEALDRMRDALQRTDEGVERAI